MNELQTNIAETLAKEMKAPVGLMTLDNGVGVVGIPAGWKTEVLDMERFEQSPRRKFGTVTVTEVDSFITLAKRQGSLTSSNIYLDVNYASNHIKATAIFNDHSDDATAGWRDHRAVFQPRFSKEWETWMQNNGVAMEQVKFAHFLDANIGDIAGGDNLPSGSDVLTFVSQLEETRKVKYGSAVNLQNGMVQIQFVEEGDDGTKGKLDVFKKFAIGIRPFFGGSAYQIEANLRYRIDRNNGEIKFWYELVRQDRILEDAAKEVIEAIKSQSGLTVIFGTPDK